MAASGRLPEITNGRFVEANNENSLAERLATLEKLDGRVWVDLSRSDWCDLLAKSDRTQRSTWRDFAGQVSVGMFARKKHLGVGQGLESVQQRLAPARVDHLEVGVVVVDGPM